MLDPEVIDEVLALKSIFSNPGEFVLLSPANLEDLSKTKECISFKLNVKCNLEEVNFCWKSYREENLVSFSVEMTVVLTLKYPNCLPQIALSCTEISRMRLSSLRTDILEYAQTLEYCMPMIMDVTMWLQHHAHLYLTQPASLKPVSKDDVVVQSILLLQLDHMRNKNRYVKNIFSWAEELTLNGRIFFATHLILILLVGECTKIKEYLRRHKACNVDLDSSGKPCKERMMTVLALEQAPMKWR